MMTEPVIIGFLNNALFYIFISSIKSQQPRLFLRSLFNEMF
ncbi:hypothetical protein RV08_GL002870 [Enterococcus mundtii]|nr:hypothetical protein RV08_GL002870 [Enterococcus mundtii]